MRRTRPEARWAARAALGTGLLVGTWGLLGSTAVQRADVRIGDLLRRAGSPRTDRLVTATTELGSLYGVAGVATALGAGGLRSAAQDALGAGALAWSVAQAGKTRVARQRPYEADGVRRLIRPPTGSSFPSGHAAVAAATMAVLADRSRSRRAARALHALHLYVAFSRVYVGVHYPTDVLGGVGLGLVLGSLWRGPVGGVGRASVRAAMRLLGLAAPRSGGAGLRRRRGDVERRVGTTA